MRINKTVFLKGLLGIIIYVSQSISATASDKITFSGDSSFYSKYLWRGFLLDEDTVFQPGIYVSGALNDNNVVKVGIWANQDLDNTDGFNSGEADYLIDYTYTADAVSISLGHTYYDFVESETESKEYYVGLSFPGIMLTPSIFIYNDYGDEEEGGGDGTYAVINLGYSKEILEKLTFDLSGHAGYNDGLFISGKGTEIGLKTGFTLSASDNLKLSPNIIYSIPSGDLSDETDGNQEEEFLGGLTLTYNL